MKNRPQDNSPSSDDAQFRSRLPGIFVAGCLLVLIIGLLLPKPDKYPPAPAAAAAPPTGAVGGAHPSAPGPRFNPRRSHPQSSIAPALTAAEIVTNKVAQFARSRRQLARAMAAHFKKTFPDEFERFFDAAETGRYEEMDAIYQSLKKQREDGTDTAWFGPQWRALTETLGVAEAAHDWPPQKLLDYGNAVLDALRPGMVYVGGTDAGCFIPTLLNETSDGEQHVILTQNALADGSYLDYLKFQYGDRMTTLTQEDSARAFKDYIADAGKRLEHDQQFPEEPKQLKPGEDVRVIDNKVQVSGQVAVMSINEKLFQTFMQNNPGVSFALEESFPFKSTYAQAAPLGPVMELGVQDEQRALTAERAAQSVDYWRTTAQQLLTDPGSPPDSEARKAYAKLVSSQAGLLLDRNYTGEAEQAFRIANEICPASPEVVFRYVNAAGEATPSSNPNGSLRNIAGIINDRGNVLGMMPHPERAMEPILGSTGGVARFSIHCSTRWSRRCPHEHRPATSR